MAISALRKLGLDYIPTIGLAKKLEEVFIHGQNDPQVIQKHSSGLILLRQIRDEAHRFAITFQRSKRKKNLTKSIFDDIPGIGNQRKTILLKKFSNIREIANLTPEFINEKTGIPNKLAIKVIDVANKFIQKK